MFCVVTVSRTSQIPSTSLWATAYHSSLSEDSERRRLCSISQKYTITQSVSASMMIFLIVCICTYQGCVWCSFPLPGLILTSTHRVTSRPVVDWAPFTKELPNAQYWGCYSFAQLPCSLPGVVGWALDGENLPCHLRRHPPHLPGFQSSEGSQMTLSVFPKVGLCQVRG